MIDLHSHVLPAIDDGAKDTEESARMLSMLASQGVDTVCATPHFYANAESVEHFIEKRARALEELCGSLEGQGPRIILGAEVKYYPGIGKLDQLLKLRIGESKLLLLEMPFSKWTEYTVRELVELSTRSGVQIVLAHIERYMKMQSDDTWRRLYECGILMQVNASFITGMLTRRRAMSMLCGHGIHFIGSDCHNTTTRAPNIGAAYSMIEKKLGESCILDLDQLGREKLCV